MKKLVEESLAYAIGQYEKMIESMKAYRVRFPRSWENGRLRTAGSWWWTAGFYPASLWLLYEYSGEAFFRKEARRRSNLMKIQRWNRFTHDLGFMLFLPLGAAYRIEGDPGDSLVLLGGAKTLVSRYKPEVGLIRSWDHGKWKYPVIIDNMMNLNYLFWASEFSGNEFFRTVATSHADHTIKNHFRSDGSTYHVVDYDPRTGEVRSQGTCQGYSDDSVWSRGQGWAVYGFTEMYRHTKNRTYLRQACTAADFIVHHPDFPADGIPYWDFNDPGIPEAYRDVSAATILASGLLELKDYVGEIEAETYLSVVDRILKSLSGTEYKSPKKETGSFILGGSVGNLPSKDEVDVPLSYADYYYIEALLRRLKLAEKTEKEQ
ncbi:MAG: glycoside hydrolase family 88 protein [Spirochaetales bacterium]|nr:glycoside hydrolase family 88 protein [Spirochaetales bacterium]